MTPVRSLKITISHINFAILTVLSFDRDIFLRKLNRAVHWANFVACNASAHIPA